MSRCHAVEAVFDGEPGGWVSWRFMHCHKPCLPEVNINCLTNHSFVAVKEMGTL
jgi:hypothetical protein